MSEDDFFAFEGMDYDEQTDSFRWELDSLVNRYLEEFDINSFVIIGALQEKMQELIEAGNGTMDFGADYDDE